jgi:hypothetical protein
MLNGPPVPQPQTRKSPFLHALKERGFLALLVVKTTEAATTSAKRRSILKEQRWLHRYKD